MQVKVGVNVTLTENERKTSKNENSAFKCLLATCHNWEMLYALKKLTALWQKERPKQQTVNKQKLT